MDPLKSNEAARLVVDTEQRVAHVIVNVDSVDLAVAEPIAELLRDAAASDVRRVEIDLSGVSFADSNVVRLAKQAHEWVRPKGAQVTIKAPPAVKRIFELTGTSDLFEIIEPA